MKYLLIFWGVPVGAVDLWYYLSFNDIHFGFVLLSRVFNDAVFNIYGSILGMDAQAVRDLLIKTFVIDTLLIAAVIYFKPFRRIRNWWVSRRQREHPSDLAETSIEDHVALPSLKENSLSSAP